MASSPGAAVTERGLRGAQSDWEALTTGPYAAPGGSPGRGRHTVGLGPLVHSWVPLCGVLWPEGGCNAGPLQDTLMFVDGLGVMRGRPAVGRALGQRPACLHLDRHVMGVRALAATLLLFPPPAFRGGTAWGSVPAASPWVWGAGGSQAAGPHLYPTLLPQTSTLG